MKDGNPSLAIAYIKIVLATYDLWPDDERTLKAAVRVLEGLSK